MSQPASIQMLDAAIWKELGAEEVSKSETFYDARGTLLSCLLHCSVSQCPEVGEYLRRFRRIHHALREEDADHSLYGIGVRRGAKAAVPPESAWGTEDFVALNIHRHSESPAAMDTEKRFRNLRVAQA